MSSKEQQVVNRKFILFTEQISEILGIKAPNIIVDESQMSTKTQLAATMVGGIVMRNNTSHLILLLLLHMNFVMCGKLHCTKKNILKMII